MSPRAGITLIFFATAGIFASWGARTPAIQEELALSAGELAIAILALEGGAVLGLPAGGALTTAAISLNDVAMNVQGVELERRADRPVLSRLHARHSFGVLAGALVGAAAASMGIGVHTHFTAVAAAGLVAGLLATFRLVDEPRQKGAPLPARPTGRLAGLSAIAFCGFLIEGAAMQWSAVHLKSEGAGEGLAAGAFACFALAVAFGRVAGDGVIDRFGRPRTVRSAGILAAAGVAVANRGAGAR